MKTESEWISHEDNHPLSHWHIVFVTDGKITCLARWIEHPEEWYGKKLEEWDEELQEVIPLDEEWHLPHWLFQTCIGPFLGNDECFGIMGVITHWMPLPKVPNDTN